MSLWFGPCHSGPVAFRGRIGDSARNVSLICAATNRAIEALSERGKFRSDLYYRLNVMSLSIPALRERGGHICLLARHFATQTAHRYNLPCMGLPDAAAALLNYDWPGNVRELKRLIERALQRIDPNVSRAARELGSTRMALRYRMKKYDL